MQCRMDDLAPDDTQSARFEIRVSYSWMDFPEEAKSAPSVPV